MTRFSYPKDEQLINYHLGRVYEAWKKGNPISDIEDTYYHAACEAIFGSTCTDSMGYLERYVRRRCAQYGFDDHTIGDIVQETTKTFFEKLSQVAIPEHEGGNNYVAYLKRIAQFKIKEQRNRRPWPAIPETTIRSTPDPGAAPENRIHARDLLRQTLPRLHPRRRLVIELIEIRGCAPEEAMASMGITSKAAFRKLLSRARADLRELLHQLQA